jgi:hypothetical protein
LLFKLAGEANFSILCIRLIAFMRNNQYPTGI